MMRLFDRHLLVFLGLIVLTGVLVMVPRRVEETQLSAIGAPPLTVEDWVGADGAPATVLPVDERAIDGLRRTYTRAGSTVWLAVSRYPATNGPHARPSLKQIAAVRGASEVTRSVLTLHPNGAPGSSQSVGLISFRHGGRDQFVMYWYQLGADVITDDYVLRLQLLLDGLRMRSRSLVLVRVAATGTRPPEALLRALLPHLGPA